MNSVPGERGIVFGDPDFFDQSKLNLFVIRSSHAHRNNKRDYFFK